MMEPWIAVPVYVAVALLLRIATRTNLTTNERLAVIVLWPIWAAWTLVVSLLCLPVNILIRLRLIEMYRPQERRGVPRE